MSVVYCEEHFHYVDTDYDAEHFHKECLGCGTTIESGNWCVPCDTKMDLDDGRYNPHDV